MNRLVVGSIIMLALTSKSKKKNPARSTKGPKSSKPKSKGGIKDGKKKSTLPTGRNGLLPQ